MRSDYLNTNSGKNGEFVLPAPVVLGDADTSLDYDFHGGKTLVVPDLGGNRTYTLSTPEVGHHYHFIYGGAAADASNCIIAAGTGNSVYFKGAVQTIITDPDASATNAQIAIYSDGDSNEKLTVTTTGAMDLHFLAISSTVWYVWGTVSSATAPAFAD